MFINNTITVIGNLTRDPELRYTPQGGTAVANTGIAWNIKRGDTKVPQFLDVTIWGDLAENVAASLTKGTRVLMVGELRYESWEQDGQKRSKTVIHADAVGPEMRWAEVAITPNQKGGGSQQPAQQAAPVQQQAYVPADQPVADGFDPDEEPF